MRFRKIFLPFFTIVFIFLNINESYASNIFQNDSSLLFVDEINLPKDFFDNKYIPIEINAESIFALSKYPELATVSIRFKYRSSKYTMQTLPHLSFLFKKRSKRKYTIIVNDNAKFYTGMDYKELSHKAKIGWIGHELSHIVDFQERNIFQIIGVGIFYGKSKYRRSLERKVDNTTIQHGLGEELFDGVDYMLNSSAANENYKKNFVKHYLSLKEIKIRIKERKARRAKEEIFKSSNINLRRFNKVD